MVGFGGGPGPLRHLGEGADRKGECLDRGVYWGIYVSLGVGNPRVGPSGWFGGAAPLSNGPVHHAVLGADSSIFEFGRGGVYMRCAGIPVEQSSQMACQAASINLNHSQETGDFNKMGPDPWGGDTWAVPGSPGVPAAGSGNGREQGSLANWTIGSPCVSN